jgi:hypothetical protein
MYDTVLGQNPSLYEHANPKANINLLTMVFFILQGIVYYNA